MSLSDFGKEININLDKMEINLMHLEDALKDIREKLLVRVMEEHKCSKEVAEQMLRDLEKPEGYNE